MSVFKSRKPRTTAVRQKDTDDAEADADAEGISPMLAASQRKKERSKGKAKLSFQEAEDDVSPFPVIRTTLADG